MLLQRFSQAGGRPALLQRAACYPPMRAALRLCGRAAASATEAPQAVAELAAKSSGVAAYAAPAYKVNIDFRFIRDNLQLVSDNCKVRGSAADPALVAQLYDDYVRWKAESDNLRFSRNENSAAMKGKLEADARAALIAKGQQLKQQLEEVEAKLVQVENALQVEGQRIPNLTHPDVPTGGEENATVLSLVGEQRAFDFPVRDHVSLGEALGILDFETAAEGVRQQVLLPEGRCHTARAGPRELGHQQGGRQGLFCAEHTRPGAHGRAGKVRLPATHGEHTGVQCEGQQPVPDRYSRGAAGWSVHGQSFQ
eukprot:GHRQ01010058.1.p1 GENE.GHRQ01010058.1~~GHRQ01010058.1.p1  ORF type:complete len:343 (+),score=64.45 GHRQ01010058.1:102-1031(+)